MNADRIARVLAAAGTLSDTGLADLLFLEVTETGGQWQADRSHRSIVELQLHGIVAHGMSDEEVARNWVERARETAAIEDLQSL